MTTKLLWLLLAVVLLAFVLRWLVPSSETGVTLYLTQHTRYIPWNVVGFWATLVLALLVGVVVLLVQYRRV